MEVEDMMVQSVQDAAVRAVENQPLTPHHQWITQWPSQVVLAVSQIIWTTEITSILTKGGSLKVGLEVNIVVKHCCGLIRPRAGISLLMFRGCILPLYFRSTHISLLHLK